MKLTWTFYPRYGQRVTLTVVYVAQLDPHTLPHGGYLDVANNRAYVDWATYRRFDDPSVQVRKDAFARLIRLADTSEVRLGHELVRFAEK